MPLAYFIHRVILLLKRDLKEKNSPTLTCKMADKFESLQSNYSRQECPDDLFMLLPSSIVEVYDTLDHTTPDKLSHSNDRHHKWPQIGRKSTDT